MGHEVWHWDFTSQTKAGLGIIADEAKPDLLFHILVNDELTPEDLVAIKKIRPEAKTLMFSCDDQWRFPLAAAKVGHYDIGITTSPDAMPLYRAKGHAHVVLSQYGVNPEAWKPMGGNLPSNDVVFIGQAYIGRPQFLGGLRSRGIDVYTRGHGFEGGAPDQDNLRSYLCGAKIVLGLNWVAGGPEAGFGPQIKGRLFENAALGVFQLVNADRHLSRYFDKGEIATYADLDDCAAKIRYYLDRPEERERITKAGQKRCLASHTWSRRWSEALPELFGVLEPANA